MSYLYTGGEGPTLQEIINKLGNYHYPTIMVRCLWDYEGEEQDDLIGYCTYKNGSLEPLDGDYYSLDDRYIKWEEYDEDGDVNLCVWESGALYEETLTQGKECTEDMVQFTHFEPTDEYLFYEALMDAGILPNNNRAATWNNPNAPVHKAWLYFSKALADNNRGIRMVKYNV